MNFSERLKNLRKQNKITQEKLAAIIGVERSSIGKYESSTTIPSNETLIKIAQFFNVSTDYLLGNNITRKTENKGYKIPVFGNVAAGVPISAIEDIIDFEEIDEELAATGEYFGLIIKGDSMEPRMTTGDVVIVKSQSTIENGETAIVLVNGDEATCKKIKKTPEGVLLISTNPNYEPLFYTNKQIEQLPVRIIGKVIELRAKF
ncbi:MAG: helix-turn-helix domain-containing protein [Clostridia bacterium]|nr:helix-turn-helix domain-containing protein [Clostridia bacterium]